MPPPLSSYYTYIYIYMNNASVVSSGSSIGTKKYIKTKEFLKQKQNLCTRNSNQFFFFGIN